MTDGWGISCKIALRWMPLDLTDDKSTLVQVVVSSSKKPLPEPMLTQIMSPYGATRPKWLKGEDTFWIVNKVMFFMLQYKSIKMKYFIPYALYQMTNIRIIFVTDDLRWAGYRRVKLLQFCECNTWNNTSRWTSNDGYWRLQQMRNITHRSPFWRR